ncbi:benzoate 4-monooxygenase cytochrome-like protein P450 [Karstenula rhodostoma CBS 690.94]|uniref:Benzoate 4-monooxygenase cytochrome-like protein P450 n=1 Tax=Karstenula rhodostoma CBS 690.94 TaxID=1392251 RepID=A0A9P4U7R9_9PLEO|nr:benzoate 4-monooxygenase cytochrome-like protein P450 [Karstenula rhodostoma CBS 690.94]
MIEMMIWLASQVAVCFALVIISKVLYNIYLHPLRTYPGPKLWAATRLTWTHAIQSGQYHLKLHELHTRYGPVVRIAPDELSYITPEALKDIYGNRNIPKNDIWAGQEEKKHPISIVSTHEETHLRNRRALTGAFTEHAISEHVSALEDLVGLMITRFRENIASAEGKAVVDLVDWTNFLTFDISGLLSYGASFSSVSQGRAHPWVEISCSFGKGIALMASINFFAPLNRALKYAMPKAVMEKMEYHKQIAHERFLQRLAMGDRRGSQDYVGSIMAYNAEKGEVKIPEEEIEANMTLLIFAGSETTSTALAAVLTQLLQAPAALEKLEEEVRGAFESEEDINVGSVARLEYLGAVIQEGIRMGPPASIGMPRVTQKEEIVARQPVPRGTFISVNQYPAFRSQSNFTQPDSFIPERFLSDSPFDSDRLEAFEPFLMGRHKCIGQKLALTIMRLTLTRLVYAFDIRVVQAVPDFGKQNTYIFWEKKPLRVELKLKGGSSGVRT